MVLKRLKDRLQGKAPKGAKRSSQWRMVRAEHLQSHPTCALCGGKRKLEVHHVVPFHVDPSLELSPVNLITLCEAKALGITCHQFMGHLGNYRLFNPNVLGDAEQWRGKLAAARRELGADLTLGELVHSGHGPEVE